MPEASQLILLIDGNNEDRDHYAHLLRTSSSNYIVIEAVTGEYGLALYVAVPAFDCVVLELDLPDMSGFEVLTKLVSQSRQPEIAVVVLTRLPNRDFLEHAMQNGAQAALHKTTTSGDFLDKTILKAISTVPRDRKRMP